MKSDSAFLYGWYTLPPYRGLGILPKALEKAFNYLYGRGIRKVYTCISHDIFPSLKAADKVGFRKIGAITYTKIFKLRLYQCNGETEEDYSKLKWMFSL
jgi:L-amino acid N-acyltransferase YncA